MSLLFLILWHYFYDNRNSKKSKYKQIWDIYRSALKNVTAFGKNLKEKFIFQA
jgi:hypothetical protein